MPEWNPAMDDLPQDSEQPRPDVDDGWPPAPMVSPEDAERARSRAVRVMFGVMGGATCIALGLLLLDRLGGVAWLGAGAGAVMLAWGVRAWVRED
jgi:hypothetical protein